MHEAQDEDEDEWVMLSRRRGRLSRVRWWMGRDGLVNRVAALPASPASPLSGINKAITPPTKVTVSGESEAEGKAEAEAEGKAQGKGRRPITA